MKANLSFAICAFLFSTLVNASPDLSAYDMVFNDEFDGASLDSSKWSTTHLWGPFRDINNEEQYYADSLGVDSSFSFNPFILTGSTLIIRADKATNTSVAPSQPPASDSIWTVNPEFHFNPDYDRNDREYISGIISSVDNFNFTHGYVEARAKLPAGQGLWSAFWLLNSKYVEDLPEIDIMEHLGNDENKVYHTLHYVDVENGWQTISSPSYETIGLDFTSNFNTFGVAWDPKKITWFIDGNPVKTVTDSDFLIAKQSMYIMANLAVGGTWPGSPDATTSFPADYELDYIRAYQLKSVPTISTAILADEYQLMFADEFSGDALDPNKWKTSYLWGPYLQINNEEQYYVDILDRDSGQAESPFDVSAGTLKITAEIANVGSIPTQPAQLDPEWLDFPTHQYNPEFDQPNGWTPEYTSGVITSYDSFKFVNGYVEARMKLPSGSGLWPAFWLLNGYYVGPMPEIDIMEFRGEEINKVHYSYHYHNEVGQLISETDGTTGGPFSDSFHTYGVQWDSEQIKWYVDGSLAKTINGSHVSTQLSYIIANLAVGGNYVASVDQSNIPATLEIDYIRAYQRKDSTPVADTTVPTTTILSPVASSQSLTPGVLFEGEATDAGGSGLNQVQIAIRDVNAQRWVALDGSSSGGWYTHFASLVGEQWSLQTALPVGRYYLYVRASDNHDNVEAWNTQLLNIN